MDICVKYSDLCDKVKRKTLGNSKGLQEIIVHLGKTKMVDQLRPYFELLCGPEFSPAAMSAWQIIMEHYLDYETQKNCRLVCKALNLYLINSGGPRSFKSRTCFTFDAAKKTVNYKASEHLYDLLEMKLATWVAMEAVKRKEQEMLAMEDCFSICCKSILLLDLASWSQMNLLNLRRVKLLNVWINTDALTNVTKLVIKNCLLNWSHIFGEMFTTFQFLTDFSYIVTPDKRETEMQPMEFFLGFVHKLDVDVQLNQPIGNMDYEEVMPWYIIMKLQKKSQFFTAVDLKKLKESLSKLRSLNLDLVYLELTNLFLLLFDYAKCSTLEELSIRLGQKHLFTWPDQVHIHQKEETSPRLNLKSLLKLNQMSLKSVTIKFDKIPGGTDADTNPIGKMAAACRRCPCCNSKLHQQDGKGSKNCKNVAKLMCTVASAESKTPKNKSKLLVPSPTRANAVKIKDNSTTATLSKNSSGARNGTSANVLQCANATNLKLPEEIANTSFLHFVAIADLLHLHYLVQNLEHLELRLGLVTFQFADADHHENLFIKSMYDRLASFVQSQRKLKTFIISEICWTINVEEQLQKLVPVNSLTRVIQEGAEEPGNKVGTIGTPEIETGIHVDASVYALSGFINSDCDKNYPEWNLLQKYCSNLKLQWIFYDLNRFGSLFEDDSKETMPHMRTFALVNDTPFTFASYDFDIICRVFPCLRELYLEEVPPGSSAQPMEFARAAREIHGNFELAKITDDDLLLIIDKLPRLRRLYISMTRCNVTDYGLTKLELRTDDQNPQTLIKTHELLKMPLENLKYLESFALIGKNKISNVSAYLAFSKGLWRLMELNFGTDSAITKKGKKFLRQRFSDRPNFKLTV